MTRRGRTVAVNGRYLGVPVTGVQRYAHELVTRLPSVHEGEVVVLAPRAPATFLGAPPAVAPLQGMAGHAWEQAVLPARFARSGAGVLFSPANWGPLATRRQLLFVHDLGPLLHPELFEPAYVRLARQVLPRLLRTCRGFVTSCERGREELADAGVARDRVHVVPPGVGAAFTSVRPGAAGDHCVFVGGTDARKNLPFLLDLWPAVHRELGLELRVVARSGTTTRAHREVGGTDGVVTVVDPSDAELAELYAGAVCLLWPSRYEGFGLPLLEAMASGAPFLSTDTGAAATLAVDPGAQVLPLDAASWVDALRRLRAGGPGVDALRARSLEAGRAATWDASALALRDAVGATLA